MIYFFSILILYTLYSQWEKIIDKKRNLMLFILLSITGIAMGVFHTIRPYAPSIAYMIERYLN